MHGYADFYRRLVLLAYHRFLTADRSLQKAQSDALTWMPERASQKTMLLGDPGSRVRRLHERRDRALARLGLLRQALDKAQMGKGQKRRLRVLLTQT